MSLSSRDHYIPYSLPTVTGAKSINCRSEGKSIGSVGQSRNTCWLLMQERKRG